MKVKKSAHSFLKLFISIAVCEATGLIGSIFTMPAVKSFWYQELHKPAFQPPNWLFAPVWTLLFACMGIAFYLIWIEQKVNMKLKAQAMTIFALQLILNVYWSVLFFGKQDLFTAFIEIILLWIVILCTIVSFYFISKRSAYILIPYILWVSFASVLNFSIWKSNPIEQIQTIPSVISPSSPEPVMCTADAKQCSDGSYVGRQGPDCHFAPCPTNSAQDLPIGYSDSSYEVASSTNAFCLIDDDCELPMDYAMRSSCPYTTRCIDDRCSIICPGRE